MNLNERRENIKRLIDERGLRIEQTGPTAVRIVGPGVDILAADLASIEPKELVPNRLPPQQRR